VVKSTYENLIAAADLENYVHTDLYPGFAKIGREEGFNRAADFWDAISVAEAQHEKTFQALADNLESGRIFKRDEERVWRCSNCGYLHTGTEAPEKCPACVRPKGFFELFTEAW
jgi:rubrerythrin